MVEFLQNWLLAVGYILIFICVIFFIAYAIVPPKTQTIEDEEGVSIPEEYINGVVTNHISPVVVAIVEEFDNNPTDFKVVRSPNYRTVFITTKILPFRNRKLDLEGEISILCRRISLKGITLNKEEEQYLYTKYEKYVNSLERNLNEQAKDELLAKIKENKL